jgi:hypothetical protein
MKALGLNEKGNKSKEKTVEEKEESGMETALNVFEREWWKRKRSWSRLNPNTQHYSIQTTTIINHSTQFN